LTQKIKNQSYYFTNDGFGVDLPNLVLICGKKKLLEREQRKRESLRKERELQRGREREIEKRGIIISYSGSTLNTYSLLSQKW
jgi:hypothetical protein